MAVKMKILVSSCLLGEHVRYDGIIKEKNELLFKLYQKGIVVSVCPEVFGGLEVPRVASEIREPNRVINKNGEDVTTYFIQGASITYDLCMKYNIKVAILKSKSPSCSNNFIYDGTFTGTLKQGKGITAALLEQNGIFVYNEHQINEALSMADIDLKDLLHE